MSDDSDQEPSQSLLKNYMQRVRRSKRARVEQVQSNQLCYCYMLCIYQYEVMPMVNTHKVIKGVCIKMNM